jgi:hypothetical protein
MNPPKPALVNKLNRLICTGRAIAADAATSDFAGEDAEGAVRFKEDAVDLLMKLGALFADLRSVLK